MGRIKRYTDEEREERHRMVAREWARRQAQRENYPRWIEVVLFVRQRRGHKPADIAEELTKKWRIKKY